MELDPQQDPFSREAIQHLAARYGSPLLVIDAQRVRQQYRRLNAALPGVDLHYALKPLPHSSLITTLVGEGAFFDLATNGEVELVRRDLHCDRQVRPDSHGQSQVTLCSQTAQRCSTRCRLR